MQIKNIITSLPGICFTSSDLMALVKLYNDTFTFFDEDNEKDTQEIDMRGVFKQRGP